MINVPNATLTFHLPEDRVEFDTAVKSLDLSSALTRIAQEVFRPARKHGYPEEYTNKLLKKAGEPGHELLEDLERRFWDILREEGVDSLV